MKGAEVSKLSKARLHRLLQLAHQLLVFGRENYDGIELLQPFLGVFGITAIGLFDANKAKFITIGSPGRELENQARASYNDGQDTDDALTGVTIRRLEEQGRITGAIAFEGLEDPLLTAEPLISLLIALRAGVRRKQASKPGTESFPSALFDVLGDEFKNALTAILTATGGLREAGPLRAEQLEMALMVEEEASRLGSLISRLARIARLDQEAVIPRMDAANLAELVAQSVEQYSRTSPEPQIVFTRNGMNLKTLVDAELIHLAFSQLLDHARDYSAPGSAILVEIEARNGAAAVTISSQGSMSSHERLRIFERSSFSERSLGARTPSPGVVSSPGLFVARKIAVAHGGTLDLDPERKGTERVAFCFSLPLVKGPSDE
jgi:signal transduction histidine kinase